MVRRSDSGSQRDDSVQQQAVRLPTDRRLPTPTADCRSADIYPLRFTPSVNVRPARSASVRTPAKSGAGEERRGAAAGVELGVDRPRHQPAETGLGGGLDHQAPPTRTKHAFRLARRSPAVRRPAPAPAHRAGWPRRTTPPRRAASSAARPRSRPARPRVRSPPPRALTSRSLVSTMQVRPVRPALMPSAAISAVSLTPTISTRSPSLIPVIATVSGSLESFLNQGMDDERRTRSRGADGGRVSPSRLATMI